MSIKASSTARSSSANARSPPCAALRRRAAAVPPSDAAAASGAQRAFSVMLRLPWELSPLFRHWLQQHYPDRAARIMARVQEMRGGRDNDARFGSRMTGQGVWAQLLRQRFHKACSRLALNQERVALDLSAFRPPAPQGGQASLF
jgi:hypothetical protein